MEYILFIIGLIIIIKSGDAFVDSSVDIAKFFNIPEIIIGATIVSIGTTLPELLVSTTSAAIGKSDMSYGNAIGSIICNTSLIAAIGLIFFQEIISRKKIIIPTLFFFISSAYYIYDVLFTERLERIDGIVLFTLFIIYMSIILYNSINNYKNNRIKSSVEINSDSSNNHKNIKIAKSVIMLFISAILIGISSRILIDTGSTIAKNFNVPETVIALTMIALGTSLPELTTCITSIIKKHPDLTYGNIIGANLFNIVLTSALSIIINPFSVPFDKKLFNINQSFIIDLPIMMISMAIMTIPTLIKQKTYRLQGVLLILIYISFTIFQFAS